MCGRHDAYEGGVGDVYVCGWYGCIGCVWDMGFGGGLNIVRIIVEVFTTVCSFFYTDFEYDRFGSWLA